MGLPVMLHVLISDVFIQFANRPESFSLSEGPQDGATAQQSSIQVYVYMLCNDHIHCYATLLVVLFQYGFT